MTIETPAYLAVKALRAKSSNQTFNHFCDAATRMAEGTQRIDEFLLVGHFHEFNEMPTLLDHTEPSALPVSRMHFRLGLILEEFLETVEAAGFQLCMLPEDGKVYLGHVEGVKQNIIEIADGLADIKYVCDGMAHEMGFDLPKVTLETHLANLTKAGLDGKPIVNQCRYTVPDHSHEEDECQLIDPSLPLGKVLKGPLYVKADVAAVLFPGVTDDV